MNSPFLCLVFVKTPLQEVVQCLKVHLGLLSFFGLTTCLTLDIFKIHPKQGFLGITRALDETETFTTSICFGKVLAELDLE